jgi:hypothetical protein
VVVMVVVVVMMMMARVAGPDANHDTAVMMVVVVMTHLHRDLRDPHSVLCALILHALRRRKTGIVGL